VAAHEVQDQVAARDNGAVFQGAPDMAALETASSSRRVSSGSSLRVGADIFTP